MFKLFTDALNELNRKITRKSNEIIVIKIQAVIKRNVL